MQGQVWTGQVRSGQMPVPRLLPTAAERWWSDEVGGGRRKWSQRFPAQRRGAASIGMSFEFGIIQALVL